MASSPHFFRIVLRSTLKDGKLMIPKKFVRNHGKFLSSPVRLMLPDGAEWKVELVSVGGMVWLHNGWHDFAEHYCLEFGSLLVFRYDGNSIFHTMIFDGTGLEIEYSCDETDGFKSNNNVDEDFEDDDDSVQILDDFPLHPKEREKPSLPCHQPYKKMKNEYSCWPKREPEECNIVRETGGGVPNFERRPKDGVAKRRQPLAALKKAEAVQSLCDLKSENPGFRIVMRQSNVQGRFNMRIPREFAQQYLNEEGGTITIKSSDGRTWSLTYKWARGNCAYISSGWKLFAKDNFLKEGDHGVFEWIKKDKLLFTKEENSSCAQAEVETKVRTNVSSKPKKATSTLNAEVGMPSSGKGNAGISTSGICQKLKDLGWTQLSKSTSKRAIESEHVKPAFVVSMLSSHVKRCNLNLPSKFVQRYLADSKLTLRDVILETSDGRKWPAKLNSLGGISQPKVELCYGWRRFVQDNGLKEGDVCVFELSQPGTKIVLFIIIFRQFEDQHCSNEPQGTKYGADLRRASLKNQNVSEAAAIKFMPRNSFFEVNLRSKSYRHPILSIPASFAREHFSPNMRTAKLQVRNKKWKVKLMQYNGWFRFSAGWSAFYWENSLKDRDKCVFEMVSKKDCTFKVTIF